MVIDVREGRELARFPVVYRRLQRHSRQRVRLLFLEAADSVLLRRFSETRRPHPLGARRSVAEGLSEERRLLEPVKRLADRVLDTTALTVHELRRRVRETVGGAETLAPLSVTVLSFGFRHGIPEDADLVFDVRFLPNPHFVPGLKRWSGRNPRVSRYVLRAPASGRFLQLTVVTVALPAAAVRQGRQGLPDDCRRLHRRATPVRGDQRGALPSGWRPCRGIDIRVRHRDVGAE